MYSLVLAFVFYAPYGPGPAPVPPVPPKVTPSPQAPVIPLPVPDLAPGGCCVRAAAPICAAGSYRVKVRYRYRSRGLFGSCCR